jgi:hypothetical protein
MADPKTGSGASALKSGTTEVTVPGKPYGIEATIRDTDKRNGKPRSILNVPAARA